MRASSRPLGVMAAIALVAACSGPAADAGASVRGREQPETTEEPMRIRMTAADQTFTAVLEDSEAARDFAALLPIELTLSDYNRTEKVADLPRRLTTAGAPEGVNPTVGDIAYFAPWGNLAIFYRDFGYSPGLVRLGRLDGGAEGLAEMDAAPARIEIIPDT